MLVIFRLCFHGSDWREDSLNTHTEFKAQL